MPASKLKLMSVHISDNVVHIWHVNVLPATAAMDEIVATLSPEELERASKFKLEKDRIHYVCRRSQLRKILSQYCNCQPTEIIFGYHRYKKPFIDMPGYEAIKFNLSFSEDLMVVAVTKHNEVGVDIEKIHEMQDMAGVAKDNFSAQELTDFNAAGDKTLIFFNIWTKKEAFIKATGRGMYYPLKEFSINIKAGFHNPSILNNSMESKGWTITEVNTHEGYIAALAVKGSDSSTSLLYR